MRWSDGSTVACRAPDGISPSTSSRSCSTASRSSATTSTSSRSCRSAGTGTSIEGAASLVHDTAWSVAAGGRLEDASHAAGLSMDGTTAYLDEIAAADPDRVSIYRKPAGSLWNGKREMVSAPLPNIREECLLWQVDADELWTADQISAVRRLFIDQPDRTAAYYWCDYFAAPEAVIATRYNYAANPKLEWLRTWRFQPGDRWAARMSRLVLVRPRRLGVIELAKKHPFKHDETEDSRRRLPALRLRHRGRRFGSKRPTTATRCARRLAAAAKCSQGRRRARSSRGLLPVGRGRHARRRRQAPPRLTSRRAEAATAPGSSRSANCARRRHPAGRASSSSTESSSSTSRTPALRASGGRISATG